MNITVVMATYNGEKYIEEQLESIIQQISMDDEIIISDDGSADNTRFIVSDFQKKYENFNIKLVDGPQKGVALNFENALTYATKDIIFFSDQDDVWCSTKVKDVIECFVNKPGIEVVMHDAYEEYYGKVTTKSTLFSRRSARKGFIHNLLFSTYYGCCMAITRDFAKKITPFPSDIVAHDQWIGLMGELKSASLLLDKPLIIHRYHVSNKSQKQSNFNKIKYRLNLLKNALKYLTKEGKVF